MKRINPAPSPSRTRSSRQAPLGFTTFVSRLLAGLAGGLLLADQAWAQAAPTASGAAGTAAATVGHAPAAAAGAAGSASLPSSSGSVFSMLLGLVAVLAVMAAIAWGLKRFGLTRPLSGNAAAKIIGGVSVGTRERVVVIEVGEQWIVVGVAPGRVNALATMPRQEQPSAAAGTTASGSPAFASWLRQTMDKRNGNAAPGAHAGNTSNAGNDGSTS